MRLRVLRQQSPSDAIPRVEDFALQQIGPAAKPAIPALIDALNHLLDRHHHRRSDPPNLKPQLLRPTPQLLLQTRTHLLRVVRRHRSSSEPRAIASGVSLSLTRAALLFFRAGVI